MNHPYRILLIVIIFIMAVIAFMMWQNRKTVNDLEEATQVPSDEFAEIKFILDDMEAQTGLDFSTPNPATFTWNVRENDHINESQIEGYFTTVTGVAEVDARAVEDYFINALFNLDVYNVAAGTTSAQSGYMNDNLVCSVATQSITDELGNLLVNSTDVTVSCGYVE